MTKINLIEKRKKYIAQRNGSLLQGSGAQKKNSSPYCVRRPCFEAQLHDWDSNTLLGAFLFLNKTSQTQKDAWTHKGGAAFATEKAEKLSSRK